MRAAKNIILAGVKAVRLYDPSPVEIKDLGTQFYLTKTDIGKPTAHSCKTRLQELNKAVQVSVLDTISPRDLSVQVLPRHLPSCTFPLSVMELLSIELNNCIFVCTQCCIIL